jgi:hypothetical protein
MNLLVDCVWNMMAHAQKPNFVFRRNGGVHLNRRGNQFSRLLAAEVWASAVVMLYTPCSEVAWRALATHSTRQFPLHFPSRASPCAITFQLDSKTLEWKIFDGDCKFYIFLTVHLGIILVSDQLDSISSIMCLFESSTCFQQLCAHPQEENCINTTSGIITLC